MASEDSEPLGADGIFKLLAWKTRAVTRLLGLPDIKGEPLQQEYKFPRERRVDGLYRLEDGSLLNLEHQSSLAGWEDLARRLITYHIMIKQEFPREPLLQAIFYTGKALPASRASGNAIEYVSLDASGRHGLRFSAALIDFRSAPVDEFRKSGLIDDLILGLMTRGGDDEAYLGEVIARVRGLPGESKRIAMEKLMAVCATMPDRLAGQIHYGDASMWTGELKEGTLLRQLVELVGKDYIESAQEEARARGMEIGLEKGLEKGLERGLEKGLERGLERGLEQGMARGISRSIVRHAMKHKIELPLSAEETELALATQAGDARLEAMLDDIENMRDFNAFVKSHGVRPLAAKD